MISIDRRRLRNGQSTRPGPLRSDGAYSELLATEDARSTWDRSVALLGDPDASAYELLFSFSTSEEKNPFLDLVGSNENLGDDYIDRHFVIPTTEETRNARPLAGVLPKT